MNDVPWLRHDLKMNYYVKTMRNFILMKRTDVFQFTRAKENVQFRFIKKPHLQEENKEERGRLVHASGCSEYIEYAIARIVDTFPISPTENNGTCHIHFCAYSDVFRLCESRTRTRDAAPYARFRWIRYSHVRTSNSRFPFGRLKEIPAHIHIDILLWKQEWTFLRNL